MHTNIIQKRDPVTPDPQLQRKLIQQSPKFRSPRDPVTPDPPQPAVTPAGWAPTGDGPRVGFSRRVTKHQQRFRAWAANQGILPVAPEGCEHEQEQITERFRHSHHLGKLNNPTASDIRTLKYLALKRKRLRHKLKNSLQKHSQIDEDRLRLPTLALETPAMQAHFATLKQSKHVPPPQATPTIRRTLFDYFPRDVVRRQSVPKDDEHPKPICNPIKGLQRQQAVQLTQHIINSESQPSGPRTQQTYARDELLAYRNALLKRAEKWDPPRPSGQMAREPGLAVPEHSQNKPFIPTNKTASKTGRESHQDKRRYPRSQDARIRRQGRRKIRQKMERRQFRLLMSRAGLAPCSSSKRKHDRTRTKRASRASLKKLKLSRYITKSPDTISTIHDDHGPAPSEDASSSRASTLKIVTWNIQGLTHTKANRGQPGKLAELTRYMATHNIDVLLLQETYVAGSPTYTTEQGKYTIYLSGTEPTHANPTAREYWGVGAILSKKAECALEKAVAHSSRLQTLRFCTEGSVTTIVNAYAPQSGRSAEERREFFEALEDVLEQHRGKSPVYLIGDFNARIHRALPGEETIFGPHAFGDPDWKPPVNTAGETDQTTNRHFLKDLCIRHSYLVKNTFLSKPAGRLVTYTDLAQKNKLAPPLEPGTHRPARTSTNNTKFAQIDLVLTPQHWAPSITNVESRRGDFVYWTQHFPLHITLRLRLKAKPVSAPATGSKVIALNDPKATEERITAKEEMARTLAELQAQTQNSTVSTQWETLKTAAIAGIKALPQPKSAPKQPYTSAITLKLIDQRNDAEKRGRPDLAKSLQKQVKRHVRKDKARYLNDSLRTGDWDSVVRHKKPFTPRTTRLRDSTGRIVGTDELASVQAQHYAQHQWNAPDAPPIPHLRPPLFPPSADIKTGDFTQGDLRNAIAKLKTKKAPGPDGIPNEIWKMLIKVVPDKDKRNAHESHLNQQILNALLALLNDIHRTKEMPDDWNDAHIAALFKGGDSADPDRYRPIALLVTAYKLYARMIQQRLAEGLESRLRATQFGFRAGHSAPEAIALLLRLLDLALSTTYEQELHILLLDWVKAFDKLSHEGLLGALTRLGIPAELVDAVGMIYNEPRFQVKSKFNLSPKHKQSTGIRQGCPLSPYLFIAWMTVMMHDATNIFYNTWIAHTPEPYTTPLHERTGVANPFPTNDIAYADDLTLISNLSMFAQRLLHGIETRAAEDNMKLNAKKTVHLQLKGPPKVLHARDQTPLQKPGQARLLGTWLQEKGSPMQRAHLAVSTRLGEAKTVYDQLQRIWRHTNISTTRKITIYKACVLQKLTYALHTHVLSKPDLDKLDAFHTRCLRKILRIPSTYAAKHVLRCTPITNKEVLKKAGECPLHVSIGNLRVKLYAHIYRRPDTHPERQLLFERGTYEAASWRGKRKTGKPTTLWRDQVQPVLKQVFTIAHPGEQYTEAALHALLDNGGDHTTAASKVAELLEKRTHLEKQAVQLNTTIEQLYSELASHLPTILQEQGPSSARMTHTHEIATQVPPTGPPPPEWWQANPRGRRRARPRHRAPTAFTKQYTIYTDGSGPGGGKPSSASTPAGWGFLALGTHLEYEAAGAVVTDKNAVEWKGASVGSNNTGELTAILEGAVWAYHKVGLTEAEFRYDSKYAANIAEEVWAPKGNHLLVDAVRAAIRQLNTKATVSFRHVYAHKGEIWNERADALANQGILLFQPPPP